MYLLIMVIFLPISSSNKIDNLHSNAKLAMEAWNENMYYLNDFYSIQTVKSTLEIESKQKVNYSALTAYNE